MSAILRYAAAPSHATLDQARSLAELAAEQGTLAIATYDAEHLGVLSEDGRCWVISRIGTIEELSGFAPGGVVPSPGLVRLRAGTTVLPPR